MGQTTLIKKKKDMLHKPFPRCHDGVGDLDFTEVLRGGDSPGKRIRFMHDDVLKPGVSIGVHAHSGDEEYYYVVAGRGVMTLDGQRHEIEAGDVAAVFPGGSHGLENTGGEDLRIIVVSVQ